MLYKIEKNDMLTPSEAVEHLGDPEILVNKESVGYVIASALATLHGRLGIIVVPDHVIELATSPVMKPSEHLLRVMAGLCLWDGVDPESPFLTVYGKATLPPETLVVTYENDGSAITLHTVTFDPSAGVVRGYTKVPTKRVGPEYILTPLDAVGQIIARIKPKGSGRVLVSSLVGETICNKIAGENFAIEDYDVVMNSLSLFMSAIT